MAERQLNSLEKCSALQESYLPPYSTEPDWEVILVSHHDNSCQVQWLHVALLSLLVQLGSGANKHNMKDSSVVEPAPPDTQVLRGCGFESHWVLLLGPRAPTFLKTESNLAPHMAASPLRQVYFLVWKHEDSPAILTFFTFKEHWLPYISGYVR